MLASVHGSALLGIEAWPVEVEVDIANGLPSFHLVGLPEATVRESRVRVRSALANCGYPLPSSRVTANLAPADLRKEGTGYDLAIAMASIAATSKLPADRLDRFVFVGELGLDGSLRAVAGALAHALGARRRAQSALVLPLANADEAALIPGVTVHGVPDLPSVVELVAGTRTIEPHVAPLEPEPMVPDVDLREVRGQLVARRALEIAAAGGHHVLLVGPPGSGKTMLARRLPTIVPKMTLEERIETTAIWSVAGILSRGHRGLVRTRPFRAPHHSCSDAGLVGGGSSPMPGELSLAHNGVLFLDELPEFRRSALEALRQPLEDGTLVVSRVGGRARLPSRVTLVAAMNPCPCGWSGSTHRVCRCPPSVVERYQGRISGPLLDRIDLIVRVDAVPLSCVSGTGAAGEASTVVRERVARARRIQDDRYGGGATNASARHADFSARLALEPAARRAAVALAGRAGLTSRGYSRVLRAARTIADLEGVARVRERHVLEAVDLRRTLSGQRPSAGVPPLQSGVLSEPRSSGVESTFKHEG